MQGTYAPFKTFIADCSISVIEESAFTLKATENTSTASVKTVLIIEPVTKEP